jgi:EAL domain-containing protein (putative c-di-GMP-specific phosphodiesterase class I)
VLLSITRLAWKTDSYTDLIASVVQMLGQHDEVVGCSVGRPDSQGVFHFESVSGEAIEAYLTALNRSTEGQIMTGDRSQGQGPSGRAWCSDEVERSVNIATDPRMAPWRNFALQAGLRSSVAIPLCQPRQLPKAILTLYSAFPGGLRAAEQIAFIALLQTILGFAIARIERLKGSTGTVPYAVRQHWSLLLRSDALQMHYQPLIDLKTGQITKVEALARFRDGDRLLTPGEFFPALASDDFLELYTRGLRQALSQRSRWLRDGIDLKVSVNLPPAALSDNRYLEATQQALAEFGCTPGGLTLEILETDAFPPGVDVLRELTKFKSPGIKLAEDDLGSEHSSLNRLREVPFDFVKIDRNISNLAGRDASDSLRFICQLVRLGHSLGKWWSWKGSKMPGCWKLW